MASGLTLCRRLMSFLVPPRRPDDELLDDEALASDEMFRSLRDLERVHRWWGGSRALDRWLLRRIAETGSSGPFRIVDVGAGSGAVTRRAGRAIAGSGHRALVFSADIQWRHLAAGRVLHRDAAPAVAADAFRLPLADGSVDWAVSTLVFHHFSPPDNLRLLRELSRVARLGFAVLDLSRHRVPWMFVSVAGRLMFESRVSLVDGQISVFQAYTAAEAREIARQAVPGATVERVFPYRLLITGPGA